MAPHSWFLPESTERTLEAWNGREIYERASITNGGHIDGVFGQRAAADVYPLTIRHLERVGE